ARTEQPGCQRPRRRKSPMCGGAAGPVPIRRDIGASLATWARQDGSRSLAALDARFCSVLPRLRFDPWSIAPFAEENSMATMPKDAQELFNEQIPEALQKFPEKAREVNAIYCFKITGEGGGTWTVDLTADPPTCKPEDTGAGQCTIEVSHDDFKTMLSDP